MALCGQSAGRSPVQNRHLVYAYDTELRNIILCIFGYRGVIIVMLNNILANFYERDIRKLIEEVNLFRNEEDLWRIQGSVKNSSGNLVLHIMGLNHFVGATLAQTGYVRDRAREFSDKGVRERSACSAGSTYSGDQ